MAADVTAWEDARFPLTLDEGAAIDRLQDLAPSSIVCTMAEPWALVAGMVPPPLQRVDAGSVELADLRITAAGTKDDARAVVGLGGGSAIDTAKFIAEARDLPLIQIPSAISVDAAFTAPYGYRDGARVRYAGHLVPVEVIADPALIRRAPAALNRAGVGDLMSCLTGLADWRLAVGAGLGEVPWNDEAAALGTRVLDELERMAPAVSSVSDDAIRWLASTHRDVGAGCIVYGARFEEGSEHFLAYVFEWLTNEHRIHGELIAACVLVMSHIQGGEGADRAARLVRTSGVDARPSHLGIDRDLFGRMMTELPGYCEREELWPSVVETVEWTRPLIEAAWRHLVEASGDG